MDFFPNPNNTSETPTNGCYIICTYLQHIYKIITKINSISWWWNKATVHGKIAKRVLYLQHTVKNVGLYLLPNHWIELIGSFYWVIFSQCFCVVGSFLLMMHNRRRSFVLERSSFQGQQTTKFDAHTRAHRHAQWLSRKSTHQSNIKWAINSYM